MAAWGGVASADTAPAPAAPAIAGLHEWSGIYMGPGMVLGLGSGDIGREGPPGPSGFDLAPSLLDMTPSLRAGVDFTLSGGWVVGGVLDLTIGELNGTDMRGGPPAEFRVSVDDLTTLAVRAGRAMGPEGDMLVYGRAGIAQANVEFAEVGGSGPWAGLAGSDDMSGLTLGAGIEYATTDVTSVYAEVNVYNFGDEFVIPSSGPPGDYTAGIDTFGTIQLGVNFSF